MCTGNPFKNWLIWGLKNMMETSINHHFGIFNSSAALDIWCFTPLDTWKWHIRKMTPIHSFTCALSLWHGSWTIAAYSTFPLGSRQNISSLCSALMCQTLWNRREWFSQSWLFHWKTRIGKMTSSTWQRTNSLTTSWEARGACMDHHPCCWG